MYSQKFRQVGLQSRFTAVSATYRDALRSKDGIEVSIPNIIVAVAVSIALIAGTILGVVWIVPWSQDNNAKSELGTVQSAEQLYYAQQNTYGTLDQLTAAGTDSNGNSTNSTLIAGSSKLNIAASANGYCAFIKSDHQTPFWVTEGSTKVQTSVPTDAGGVTCPTSAPRIRIRTRTATTDSPAVKETR